MSTVVRRLSAAPSAGWSWGTVALGILVFVLSFPLWH